MSYDVIVQHLDRNVAQLQNMQLTSEHELVISDPICSTLLANLDKEDFKTQYPRRGLLIYETPYLESHAE